MNKMMSYRKRSSFINLITFSLNQIRHVSKQISNEIIYSPRKREKFSFLVQVAGMSKKKAKLTLLMIEEFNNVSLDAMKLSFSTLKNAGYAGSIEQYPDLLCIPNAIIKSRMLFLKDCNFKDEKIPWLISDFNSLPNKRISILKNFGVLPSDFNLLEHFFRLCNVPMVNNKLMDIDDWTSLKDVYWKFYKLYLSRELDIDEKEVGKSWRNIRWTSFRSIRYNLKLMREVFGFTNQDLINKPYLLHADPENVLFLLKSYKEINIKEMVKKNPKLATLSKDIVSRNAQILLDNQISSYNRPNFPALFAINSDLNFNRLRKVLEIASLSAYVYHPRLALLVKKATVAEERLHALKKLNMKCFTLNQLTCSNQDTFARHLANGVDKVYSKDIVQFLKKVTQYSTAEIREKLKKNPYIGYVPLFTVIDTTDYLQKMDFSPADIFNSLQIVLYKRSVVEDAILNRAPLQLNSLNYFNMYNTIEKKTLLALALYCIEKEFGFTGSGVWKNVETDTVDLFKD